MKYEDALFIQLAKQQKVLTRSVLADLVIRTMKHWAYDLGLSSNKFERWVDENIEGAVQYVEAHGINVVDISS